MCFLVNDMKFIFQIPGINIPISDIGYYVISLLICSLFHELGHASAAVRYENIRNGSADCLRNLFTNQYSIINTKFNFHDLLFVSYTL